MNIYGDTDEDEDELQKLAEAAAMRSSVGDAIGFDALPTRDGGMDLPEPDALEMEMPAASPEPDASDVFDSFRAGDLGLPDDVPDMSSDPVVLGADTTPRPSYGDPERPRTELPESSPWESLLPQQQAANDNARSTPWQSLAQSRGGGGGSSMGGPPMAEEPNKLGLGLALGLDVLLNKGRSAGKLVGAMASGGDTAYENYERQMKHAKDVHSMQPRAAGNEASLALQQQRLALAQERFAASKDKTERQLAHTEALRQVDSPETRAEQDAVISAGLMPEEEARKHNGEVLRAYRYQFSQEAQQLRGDKLIRGRMMLGDDLSRGRSEHTSALTEGRAVAGEERELGRAEEKRAIPGYTRRPDAAKINETTTKQLQETTAALAVVDSALDRLIEIDESIPASDRVKGVAGFTSDQLALANEYQQEVASAIRKIANFGTPQAAELAITYARIPEVASRDGFFNGAAKYRAMKQVMRNRVNTELGAYGYDPVSPAGGGGSSPGQRTIERPRAPTRREAQSAPIPGEAPALGNPVTDADSDEWEDL